MTMVADRESLLARCTEGVAWAQAAGALQAEVIVDATQRMVAGAQNNDLHQIDVVAETQYGVRVFLAGGRMGFATTNRSDRLAQAAADAVAVARVAPADPLAALPSPRPIVDAPDQMDGSLLESTPAMMASSLVDLLREIRAKDARVSIDKAELETEQFARAIVSSEGVSASWRCATTSAMVFGMAVEGGEVGSFSYDQVSARTAAELMGARSDLVDRFVRNCVGALSATPGESFRGSIVLTEEVVASLLLSPLVSSLSAEQVRQGRSPLAARLGEAIACAGLTLIEEGAGLSSFPLAPFDREGMPRSRRSLVTAGRLESFLWSSYEGRAAGNGESGHAQGNATSLPQVGPCALSLSTGSIPRDQLEGGDSSGPLLVVTRFSGNTDSTSGDFSGVVKGGFLVQGGHRRPVREVTIAGNLFSCLQNLSGISSTARRVFSSWHVPALRIEDISVTAG